MLQILRNWFRNRQAKRLRLQKNPWKKLLTGLYQEVDNVSRRPLPPWQLFMSYEHDSVMKLYDARFPHVSSKKRARDINARSKIARELFDDLTEEEQEEYEAESMRLYEESLEANEAERKEVEKENIEENVEA